MLPAAGRGAWGDTPRGRGHPGCWGETEARSSVAAGLSCSLLARSASPKGFFFSSAYSRGVSRGNVLGDPVPGVTLVPVGPCGAIVGQVAQDSTSLQPPGAGCAADTAGEGRQRDVVPCPLPATSIALAPAPPPASVSLPTHAHAGSRPEGPRITEGVWPTLATPTAPRGCGRGAQGKGHGTAVGVSWCPVHVPRQKLSVGSRCGPGRVPPVGAWPRLPRPGSIGWRGACSPPGQEDE